jgi:hypothetical protein
MLEEYLFIKSKRVFVFLGLFLIIITLSSCVFVRMVKVKNQLNDFETNYDLNDERGLTLVFKNPVLLTDDVIWLMKGGPVSVEKMDKGELWTYVFQKQHTISQDEGDAYDIPILMVMNDDKLTEVTFPERFLKNLSIPLLKKMLTSMGNADVSKLRRSASSKFSGDDPTEIPTSDNVIETLGAPYEIEQLEGNSEFSYLYYLEDAQGNGSKDNLNFELWFIAGDQDKTLKRVGGKLRGVKMSLDFDTIQQ